MKKTVLITGASSGIGKAAAEYFLSQGWNVAATMRVPDQTTDLAKDRSAFVTRLDVQDPPSITRAIQDSMGRFDHIDVLVNNAGFSLAGPFETVPDAKIREEFDVNVFGVMNVCRAILPQFRKRQDGVIVNVSSRAGIIGLPLMSLYCASKFALEGFSEALYHELGAQNIAVKVVAPGGGANTNFGQRMLAETEHNTEIPAYDHFVARISAANESFAKLREGFSISTKDIAKVIFDAATDGTGQFKYTVGHDIPPFIKAKKEMGEQEYMEFMKGKYSGKE